MKSRVHPTYKTHYRVGNWRVLEMAVEWKHLDAMPCRIRQVKAAKREMAFYDFAFYAGDSWRGVEMWSEPAA